MGLLTPMAKRGPAGAVKDPGHLGAFVRARRDELGLTQEKLAELTGLSSTYVAMVERGEKRNPTRATQDAFARALQCEVEDLFSAPLPVPAGSPLERFVASGLGGKITPSEMAKLQAMERLLGAPLSSGGYLRALDLIRSEKAVK